MAKYTINPAIGRGMGHLIGSVEVNTIVDIKLLLNHSVLYNIIKLT